MLRIIWSALLLVVSIPALGLEPDELLLITNKNIPDGRVLAEYYSAKRSVPKGRILELNLPITEEIPFAAYEAEVVPKVREFLSKNGLTDKVKCAVTFYGVPLRIAARVNTPTDQVELAALKDELTQVTQQIADLISQAEVIAKEADPQFIPRTGKALDELSIRSMVALRRLSQAVNAAADPQKKQALVDRIEPIAGPLVGEAPAEERRLQELVRVANEWTPQQKEQAFAMRDRLLKMRAQFDEFQGRRGDPEGRKQLKELVKSQMSILEYGRLIEGLIGYFATDNTDAAFDSELALVQWHLYSRVNSLPNPLAYNVHLNGVPPVLMTMRLDGPSGGSVRDLILGSLKAETEGLEGSAVLDSGGHLAIDPKNPNYAAFDASIRNLGDFIRAKTKLGLVEDRKKEVLPANSVKGVALYCGWYSVRRYVPSCSFNPGAVGFHIASYELVSLRNEGETGWCRGLISDGISSTLGAVAEPFLNAFPQPDDFFPLLLTGEWTLAECYWKTLPMVSWRISTIGDPLYRPYAKHPALPHNDLPERLRAIQVPSSQPTTKPSR